MWVSPAWAVRLNKALCSAQPQSGKSKQVKPQCKCWGRRKRRKERNFTTASTFNKVAGGRKKFWVIHILFWKEGRHRGKTPRTWYQMCLGTPASPTSWKIGPGASPQDLPHSMSALPSSYTCTSIHTKKEKKNGPAVKESEIFQCPANQSPCTNSKFINMQQTRGNWLEKQSSKERTEIHRLQTHIIPTGKPVLPQTFLHIV